MDSFDWSDFDGSPCDAAARAKLRPGDRLLVRSVAIECGRTVSTAECMTLVAAHPGAFVAQDESGLLRACKWDRALQWHRPDAMDRTHASAEVAMLGHRAAGRALDGPIGIAAA